MVFCLTLFALEKVKASDQYLWCCISFGCTERPVNQYWHSTTGTYLFLILRWVLQSDSILQNLCFLDYVKVDVPHKQRVPYWQTKKVSEICNTKSKSVSFFTLINSGMFLVIFLYFLFELEYYTLVNNIISLKKTNILMRKECTNSDIEWNEIDLHFKLF